ncbi:MAG: hypothetical protein AB7E80_15300 [Hyphomicrobiaceae bacterium]
MERPSRVVSSVWGCVLLALPIAAPAAAQDCRGEVEAAFVKQRAGKSYRFTAVSPSPQGETRMTIDYQMPDRMYQKVEAPGHPAPVETIAIAKWAWGTMGGGWEELQPQFAQSITSHVHSTLVAPPPVTASFACLGKVVVDGTELLGYRTLVPGGPGPAGGPPISRTIYIDPASGLPVRNTVAEEGSGAAPIFDARYSYPADIAIEAPIGGPATRAR